MTTQQVNLDDYEKVENEQDQDYGVIHFWTPDDEGDAIAGTVAGQVETQYGTAWVIEPDEPVEVKARDEPVEAFFVNYTALNDRLEPLEGSEVAIAFDGVVKSESGRDYKTFEVYRRGDGE